MKHFKIKSSLVYETTSEPDKTIEGNIIINNNKRAKSYWEFESGILTQFWQTQLYCTVVSLAFFKLETDMWKVWNAR